MNRLQRQLWHRLSQRQVAVLSGIAALDAALLIALGYGLVSAQAEVILAIAPSYSALFLVLAGSLTCFAERGRVSWSLVTSILLVGPLGAAVVLRLCRRSPSS
jgi:hypothetical protein